MDTSDIEVVRDIHFYFKKSGLRLSIAESCTGGFVSHFLTNLPGASLFLDSSLVCYSIESKKRLLGLKGSLVKRHGVISEEAARAMAIGVRQKRKTDFSLSITGNLGPKPMEEKMVGLVYMAVDWEKETTSRGMIFEGKREEIKHRAAISSLEFLREAVKVWT